MKSTPLAVLLLSLAACGGGSSSTPAGSAAQATQATPAGGAPAAGGTPAAGTGGAVTAIRADQVIEPPMAAIPAGKFAWPGHADRQISVPAFQMAKHEVTVAQWRQFVAATGYRSDNPTCWKLGFGAADIVLGRHTWDAPNFPQNEFHPVTCVSLVGIKAYVAWLQSTTGKAYRLPSEAEWEYAFRAGQDAPWWGDAGQVCRYANVRDVAGIREIGPVTGATGSFPCSDGAAWTSVVGMYAPNPFGLYDILGNLNETLDDCPHASYANAPQDGALWNTGCDSAGVVRRGGLYDQFPLPLPGQRGYSSADNQSSMEGFRLALSAPQGAVTGATRTFEDDLAKAQAAERSRRQPAP